MKNKSKKPVEGWAPVYPGSKWHYIRGMMSLCRKWMYTGEDLEQGNNESPDNCKTCRNLLEKEKK